ncbi:MAG: methylmalonyl Co-A mutase-associated GTPase MeaB, partial [Kiloniellales bacterium]
VETVGVGQSETAVAGMVDLFLLLLQPGGGDELQGIKRGIMELADLLLVNKADGELTAAAKRAAADYRSALRMLRPGRAAWRPRVLTCSALEGRGMAEVWQAVGDFRAAIGEAGPAAQRAEQARGWLWRELGESLTAALRADPAVVRLLPELEAAVTAGRLAPSAAARRLLETFLGRPATPKG